MGPSLTSLFIWGFKAAGGCAPIMEFQIPLSSRVIKFNIAAIYFEVCYMDVALYMTKGYGVEYRDNNQECYEI